MKIVIITGSSGLVGSETAELFHKKKFKVIGIDNDSRSYFFGKSASTKKKSIELKKKLKNYIHFNIDIRNYKKTEKIFKKFKKHIKCIIHTAAQPSHDWAIKEPLTDFNINALGTLNLLMLTKKYTPKSIFIHVSTNKVYGDRPNFLPLLEKKERYEIKKNHKYFNGIDEKMSIDQSTHSLFGSSKTAADIYVQEYGRNLGIKTGIFRLGCITGKNHAGAELHGFLSYLFKAIKNNMKYTIFGYKGKQVRDNIHSTDLVNTFSEFHKIPKKGAVYNIGGGLESNCSMLEAIKIGEEISGKKLNYNYVDDSRIGDHIWYISDLSKFKKDYPNWKISYNINRIIEEIYNDSLSRLK